MIRPFTTSLLLILAACSSDSSPATHDASVDGSSATDAGGDASVEAASDAGGDASMGDGAVDGGVEAGAPFGTPCTISAECASNDCFDFGAKGKVCTQGCNGPQDCPVNSAGCSALGKCKPN